MFKEYYNSREFGDVQDEEQDNATQLAIQSLREKFRLSHQGKESFRGGRDETCVLTPSTLMKNFVKIETNN